MKERTARRIAAALERIVNALERQPLQPLMPPPIIGQPVYIPSVFPEECTEENSDAVTITCTDEPVQFFSVPSEEG